MLIFLQKSGLTENEIHANALIFFLAGFDTTMKGLTYIIYNLARNPECQQKLIEEIDSIVGDRVIANYNDHSIQTYLKQGLFHFFNMGIVMKSCNAIYSFPIIRFNINTRTVFNLNITGSLCV